MRQDISRLIIEVELRAGSVSDDYLRSVAYAFGSYK